LTSYYTGANDDLRTLVLPASGGFVVGVAIYPINTSTATVEFIRIREGNVTHVALALVVGQILQVRVNGIALAIGTHPPIPVGSWTYVEFKGTIDSAGSYEVRLDGVSVPSLTGTGNTRNGGVTGQWNQVGVLAPVQAWEGYSDDLYVCDQSGPAPRNTFLGPVKIETMYPQTDAVAVGSNTGLTPTGSDHGAMVDETPANTSDYNQSATIGAKDTYHFPTPILAGTIMGVQTNLFVAKSNSTLRQACPVVRTDDGVDHDGPNISLLTTFQFSSLVWPQCPKTTPEEWTVTSLTALQVGMKVTV
jgi:hypothetical protein